MNTKVSRNNLCPCGSGKKFKKCCIDKNRNSLNNIIDFFCQYEPESTFLWLQTLITHPNNRIFQLRLEYLLALFFSVPKERFGIEKSLRNDIIKLIRNIQSEFDEIFISLEDFEGFDQSQLIPYFFQHNKYFIFYSLLERPHEHWENVKDIYITNSQNTIIEVDTFVEIYTESLQFQTKLLADNNIFKELGDNNGLVYIPSDKYHKALLELYRKGDKLPNDNNYIELGVFSELSDEKIFHLNFDGEL
jgi:hypothetical protein